MEFDAPSPKRLDAHLMRACHWSDGGTEFVFSDGCVLSFCGNMETFVACHPNKHATSSDYLHPSPATTRESNPDMMITSMCLSMYKSKVTAALDVFNRFSSQPRLIDGLTARPTEAWTSSAPIDALVLSDSAELFTYHRDSEDTEDLNRSNESRDSCASPTRKSNNCRATLTCALRKVSMTMDGNRQTFHVRWPAVVYDSNNSEHIFVAQNNRFGPQGQVPKDIPHYFLNSPKAVRYVWIEQTFSVLEPPEEWTQMLEILTTHLSTRGTFSGANSTANTSHAESSLNSLTLPETLRPRAASSVASVSGQYKPTVASAVIASSAVATTNSTSGAPMKFSSLKPADALALVASTQIHAVAGVNLHSPSATVQWRFDYDCSSSRMAPYTIVWGYGGGMVGALVYEDLSYVLGHPSGAAGYCIQLTRSSGEDRAFHQSSDGSTGLPTFVNASALVSGEQNYRNGSSVSSAVSALLSQGRYLPDVGALLIGVSQRNLVGCNTAIVVINESSQGIGRGRSVGSSDSGEVVHLQTRVDKVGTFTALTNGVVRCHFDDRTILTLLPDLHDTDEGLACHMIGRDATSCTVRAVHVAPGHVVFPYMSYLLPFRRFSKLSASDRSILATSPSTRVSAPQSYEEKARDEVDVILYRTQQALNCSRDMSMRSKELLSQ